MLHPLSSSFLPLFLPLWWTSVYYHIQHKQLNTHTVILAPPLFIFHMQSIVLMMCAFMHT